MPARTKYDEVTGRLVATSGDSQPTFVGGASGGHRPLPDARRLELECLERAEEELHQATVREQRAMVELRRAQGDHAQESGRLVQAREKVRQAHMAVAWRCGIGAEGLDA